MKIIPAENCAICQLHLDPTAQERYEIQRSELWVLRHHPDPAPLPGWLLLNSRRYCSGPVDFTAAESSDWGCAVQDASDLVKQISGCERVYAIAFGEGAQHLHLHLIPRHLNEPAGSFRWRGMRWRSVSYTHLTLPTICSV